MTEKTQQTVLHNYPELIPVSKFNDYIPHPSVGAIRQLMFYNTKDFNTKVIRRIGKRLYVSTTSFFEWVESSNRKSIA